MHDLIYLFYGLLYIVTLTRAVSEEETQDSGAVWHRQHLDPTAPIWYFKQHV